VQRCSAKVWDEGADFRDAVLKDREISSVLSTAEIHQIFDLKHALRHIPAIFERVLPQNASTQNHVRRKRAIS
jgi:adenylosuccinate lyase